MLILGIYPELNEKYRLDYQVLLVRFGDKFKLIRRKIQKLPSPPPVKERWNRIRERKKYEREKASGEVQRGVQRLLPMSSNSSSSSSSSSSFVLYQSPTKPSLRVSAEEQSTRLGEIETVLSSCDRKRYLENLEKSNQFPGDMENSIDVSKFAKAGISLLCYREPIA